jgi:ERO1-like protein alpha
MCSLKDCSVCECDPKELPKSWGSGESMDMIEQSCDNVQHESDVDRAIQDDIKIKLEEAYRNPWVPEKEQNGKNVEYTYVNLLRNPERYTGYKGEHANRIWKTIYEQKCFADVNVPPGEEGDSTNESTNRIFYRIISGIHSSISAHIVKDYLLDEATRTWGPNLAMFQVRRTILCAYLRPDSLGILTLWLYKSHHLRRVSEIRPLRTGSRTCTLPTYLCCGP